MVVSFPPRLAPPNLITFVYNNVLTNAIIPQPPCLFNLLLLTAPFPQPLLTRFPADPLQWHYRNKFL